MKQETSKHIGPRAVHQSDSNSARAIFFVATFALGLLVGNVSKADEYSHSSTPPSAITLLQQVQLLPSPYDRVQWYEARRVAFDALSNPSERIEALHLIGQSYYKLGMHAKAKEILVSALTAVPELDEQASSMKATINNDLGLIAIGQKDRTLAIQYFQRALELSKKGNNLNNQVISATNLAKTNLEEGRTLGLANLLVEIGEAIQSLPPNAATAHHLLALGQIYRDGAKKFVLRPQARLDALNAYLAALTLAQADRNKTLQAFANGYIGELYEDEGRAQDAIQYTRLALFYAQEVSDDTLLYRWQWQMARLTSSDSGSPEALDHYRQAVSTLNRSRTQMTLGSAINFKQSVGPVFYEFADLLLKNAVLLEDGELKQAVLQEAIDVLEAVKLAEVEDYFDSECVVLPEQKIKLTDIKTDSAIIYPVLLQDRTELIVQLPDGIKQYTSKVSASDLRETVNQFRTRVEQYSASHDYLAPAQLLYSWLMAPLEKDLLASGVNTVVFVPDGPLRSIPISALHDGEQCLIQKYAVATTQGITLTDPKPFQRDEIRVLANGLTEAVQGYSALPSVKQELNDIKQIFDTTLYEDQGYQLQTVEGEMTGGSYNIVHFATHGEFNSDHSKSFLLTYDDKLTMDRLEDTIGLRRFQSEPIELLVLSACQTAVGDDEAALGLAGIAIKAGARSALATLWFINDQATSTLVADFYKQLNQDDQTKAKALQTAQVNMINETNYTHPSFWAPFLMIGNWL